MQNKTAFQFPFQHHSKVIQMLFRHHTESLPKASQQSPNIPPTFWRTSPNFIPNLSQHHSNVCMEPNDCGDYYIMVENN
ncbi:hypothetical protein [Methanobrevibacter sp.]|uniref:hypothetical protein n=1 Tax=Methanobrevibacter sp. TaxID=66852 RepID=UPI00386D0A38